MTRIWLIGMSGSGKTTAGRRAAESIAVDFIDTDDLVVERARMSIAEIWKAGGEPEFRELEGAVIDDLGDATGIVAGGGGSVLDPRSRRIIESSDQVIWLEASPEVIRDRVRAEGRPLIAGGDDVLQVVDELLRQRQEIYRSLSTSRIDTDAIDIESVAREIARAWNA